MNPADIQFGKPPIDGRYVCFIRCAPAQAREWVEPVIMVWHSDKWQSSFMPQANVLGWLGPIPPMKAVDLMPPVALDESPAYQETVASRAQEFDL